MLTGATLSLWLKEEGLSLSVLGMLSFLHLPYALKFLWASWFEANPPVSFQRNCGARRGWINLCQLAVLGGIVGIASGFFPARSLWVLALSLWIAWWAASQDLLMQASQRDMLERSLWGYGEAVAVLGYRLGILLGGAGAMYLSSFYTWPMVWGWMALALGVLLGTSFLLSFKVSNKTDSPSPPLQGRWLDPFNAFFREMPWKVLLSFMVLYRLQDYLLGFFPQFFYLELGFSKAQLALGYKVFGIATLTLGGFLGGYWVRTKGYAFTLMAGLGLHMVSNIGFFIQLYAGVNLPLLYATVALEELTKGIAITAFFSYQLLCCRPPYVMTQLAILIAFTTLAQSLLGGLSGFLIDTLGWPSFFGVTSMASLPALWMLWTNRIPYTAGPPPFSGEFIPNQAEHADV